MSEEHFKSRMCSGEQDQIKFEQNWQLLSEHEEVFNKLTYESQEEVIEGHLSGSVG